jgi:hypothetical protein
MPRVQHVFAVLFLCLLPGRLACQQPYPRLARVVGAVRAAALAASPVPSPRAAGPLDLGFVLPPLAHRPGLSHRQVIRINLTERLQFRATGDWVAPGPVATLGFGLRF